MRKLFLLVLLSFSIMPLMASNDPGGETVTADGSDNLLEVTNMLSIEDSFECPVGAEFEVRGIR